ncbi:hypothetical protein [Romboutsia sp.]|uniref:hypothetical protein n=1 Tax=Romboutsia sp. TaxID=1965302 RepID=UPI003F2BA330
MEDKNILNLIDRFEKSIDETEKLTNSLIGLEGVLDKLDNSMHEVYELTKVESLTKKSEALIQSLNQLKMIQREVNKEYTELVNFNLYNEEIKEDISTIKDFIVKINDNMSIMKKDRDSYKLIQEEENKKFKEDILYILKENSNKDKD